MAGEILGAQAASNGKKRGGAKDDGLFTLWTVGFADSDGKAAANIDGKADAAAAAGLYIDSSDWEGAAIALKSLQGDIEMASGIKPEIANDISRLKDMAVLAGTIGKSEVIDNLIADGKIDISGIAGKWESYLMAVVPAPHDNIKRALVIAGSDKRGTIYGIYKISEMIGISPWVWWADSVPQRSGSYFIPADYRLEQGSPSVKYRGIFLNDEAPSLSGWLSAKFNDVSNIGATKGCGFEFYKKVFELILRLKGNYLWPVMWNNSFHTDDPQNSVMADTYGIVMGTSHQEHMTCADKEWTWARLGEWNYFTNKENIYDFWKTGVNNRKEYESVLTLGMRGQADTAILGPGATLRDNMDLVEKVIGDQRQIITDVYGSENGVPQMLALYKEVEDFYYGSPEHGKLGVPDDVTLMLCDDNHGNIRTLPTQEMKKRSGGFGMYYHFDYRGSPISYQWINQTPLVKAWEQLTTAYDAGIDRIWIVNVGDLKPMEFPMEYFLTLAYDYDTWSAPNKIAEFTRRFAAREFGEDAADDTADVICEYTKILGARKAEVVMSEPSTFSLTAFDEASRVLNKFEDIVKKAEAIYDRLPPSKKDTFFQLVLYGARASMNVYKTNICAAWSIYLAEKNLPAANEYAKLARAAFDADAADTEYYNTKMSGGKWNGIMRQNHMNYTAWDGPQTCVVPNIMPKTGSVPTASGAGSNDRAGIPDAVTKSQGDFETTLQANKQGGNIPADILAGQIEKALKKNTYVETCGYVSINPARFTSEASFGEAGWRVIDDYGRDGDSIKLLPNGMSFEVNLPDAPYAEYSFYMQTPGEYKICVFIAPTGNFIHQSIVPLSLQLRFSAQINTDSRITASGMLSESYKPGGDEPTWAYGVMNNMRMVQMPAGELSEGIHTLRIYAVDPGVVIQKIVIAPPNAELENISKTPQTYHFMGSYFGPPESYYIVSWPLVM
ncbi:MAG: glycosyl hydrolase 115 family protein [Oscillospiraceae bacterium]|nr:glycosyl hydrolase 115 family protein [Oscillospiraceae bacterium]